MGAVATRATVIVQQDRQHQRRPRTKATVQLRRQQSLKQVKEYVFSVIFECVTGGIVGAASTSFVGADTVGVDVGVANGYTHECLDGVSLQKGFCGADTNHAASLEPVIGPDQTLAWQGGSNLSLQIPVAWSQLRGPIGTVCVTGADRIGKSTLLTLWKESLLGNRSYVSSSSFSAGHSRNSHTKGLWSAILRSDATGLDYHLNLCDSQGLKQADELREANLFAANVLIPHVLVYMVMNVIQRDEIHDLARLARFFNNLPKNELSSFGRVLSPHLIVAIREESDLDSEDGKTANDHLEDVLAVSAFAAKTSYASEKVLIRNMFQTREAVVLRELPVHAQRVLRTTGSVGEDGIAWLESGKAVLERVRFALDSARATMPHGGRELASWYQSVVQTVNSHDERSLGRLVGHGERLAAGRWLRTTLREWSLWALLAIAALAVVTLVSGALQRWLDFGIWVGWVMCWNCYVGMSPYLVIPFDGVVPSFCDRLFGTGVSLLRVACAKASPPAAALLLSTTLACISYPLLTAQLRRIARMVSPFPSHAAGCWNRMACLVAVAFTLLLSHEVASSDNAVHMGERGLATCSFAARVALSIVVCSDAFELAAKRHKNRCCNALCEKGMALHEFISKRIPELKALESEADWEAHYRQHSKFDAMWRLRQQPLRRRTLLWLQNLCLLAWGCLIYPHVDLILAIGVAVNTARLGWIICRFVFGTIMHAIYGDEVMRWYTSLDDTSSADFDEEYRFLDDDEVSSMLVPPETLEEVANRAAIEEMRRAQEAELPRMCF